MKGMLHINKFLRMAHGIHLAAQTTTCCTCLTTHLVHSTLEWKNANYNIQMPLIQSLYTHIYIIFCSVTIYRGTQENYTQYCHGISFINRKLL